MLKRRWTKRRAIEMSNWWTEKRIATTEESNDEAEG
jgi:hypothetical protein